MNLDNRVVAVLFLLIGNLYLGFRLTVLLVLLLLMYYYGFFPRSKSFVVCVFIWLLAIVLCAFLWIVNGRALLTLAWASTPQSALRTARMMQPGLVATYWSQSLVNVMHNFVLIPWIVLHNLWRFLSMLYSRMNKVASS